MGDTRLVKVMRDARFLEAVRDTRLVKVMRDTRLFFSLAMIMTHVFNKK